MAYFRFVMFVVNGIKGFFVGLYQDYSESISAVSRIYQREMSAQFDRLYDQVGSKTKNFLLAFQH